MSPVPSPSISIIGAGFAGLTSGRCLKMKGIPSRIFDKRIQRQDTSRIITLRPWAYEPLAKVLDINYQQAVEKDQKPDSIMSDSMYCPQGQIEDSLSRDLHVEYSQELSEIERLESQMQGLVFNSMPSHGETFIKSQLIVGADGVHSGVRHLVSPEVQPRILPYVVYYGSRRMTARRYKGDIAPHMKYPAMFQFRKETQTLLRIIPCLPSSLLDDAGHVHVKYTYSRPAHEKDPLFRPDRRVWEAETIPNEFYQEIEGLKDLGPVFGKIFHPQRVRQDKVLHWLMRSLLVPLEKLQELADQGILLIGDAAHTIPILGSEGANLAIKDGIDLANYLADNAFSQLRGFYGQRYPEWQRAMSESERRLFDMHDYDHDIFEQE
ncbi:hypothetical protein JMJ35_002154 [Cladonia borealis]|uniref:FAD-binding domain-containing protein n=1 Tax=Cladonia borealis TaxID=184061 RepID=A0AA39V9P2_9LECA|nr:hypothetical protein JMJ35_002154 [Cladonia borealis]